MKKFKKSQNLYWYLANAGVCFCLIFAGTITAFKENSFKKILKNLPTVTLCCLTRTLPVVPINLNLENDSKPLFLTLVLDLRKISQFDMSTSRRIFDQNKKII
jgi:hypothetical protein